MTDDKRESPGRRDYDDPNAALNEHIKENDNRLRRLFVGALIALSIIGLATATALVGFGIVLYKQQKTADQLAHLVTQNNQFAKDIQDQRRESIRETCRAQTEKHDKTIEALMKGSDLDQKNAPNEAVRREIRRRRDVTISLIDVLSPAEDCEKKVREAVQGG